MIISVVNQSNTMSKRNVIATIFILYFGPTLTENCNNTSSDICDFKGGAKCSLWSWQLPTTVDTLLYSHYGYATQQTDYYLVLKDIGKISSKPLCNFVSRAHCLTFNCNFKDSQGKNLTISITQVDNYSNEQIIKLDSFSCVNNSQNEWPMCQITFTVTSNFSIEISTVNTIYIDNIIYNRSACPVTSTIGSHATCEATTVFNPLNISTSTLKIHTISNQIATISFLPPANSSSSTVTSQSEDHSLIGAIVGPVVAVVAIGFCVFVFIICLRKHNETLKSCFPAQQKLKAQQQNSMLNNPYSAANVTNNNTYDALKNAKPNACHVKMASTEDEHFEANTIYYVPDNDIIDNTETHSSAVYSLPNNVIPITNSHNRDNTSSSTQKAATSVYHFLTETSGNESISLYQRPTVKPQTHIAPTQPKAAAKSNLSDDYAVLHSNPKQPVPSSDYDRAQIACNHSDDRAIIIGATNESPLHTALLSAAANHDYNRLMTTGPKMLNGKEEESTGVYNHLSAGGEDTYNAIIRDLKPTFIADDYSHVVLTES